MDADGAGHLARWARFHTGYWHAYAPDDGSRRHVRSVCGFATSTVDDMQSSPGAAERWQCRQCRLVVGLLKGTDESASPEAGAPVDS
jgi:hypothetical protein